MLRDLNMRKAKSQGLVHIDNIMVLDMGLDFAIIS
jgi:hypothetical protein